MASKAQTAAVWPLWFLLAAGWVLLLCGLSALQQNCSGSAANSPLLGAGTVSYLSPVQCSKFYRLSWWTTWYLVAIVIMLGIFVAARTFHTFRAGILGLCAPLLVLLMHTCNTYFYFNGLDLEGETKTRARVVLAGAIIASIALFALLLVLGVFDEEAGKAERRGGTGEPKGETWGGVYQPTEGQRGAAEAATYT